MKILLSKIKILSMIQFFFVQRKSLLLVYLDSKLPRSISTNGRTGMTRVMIMKLPGRLDLQTGMTRVIIMKLPGRLD